MNRLAIRILGPSIVLAILLGIAGSAVLWVGKTQHAKSLQAHANASRRTTELEQKYRHAAQEEPLIQTSIGRFQTLQRQRLLGAENRLDWAEAVRNINDSLRLQNASFSFSPQKKLKDLGPDGKYALNVTQMHWQAQLLHEGDLVRVISKLQGISSAVVSVKHCTLGDLRSSQPSSSEPVAMAYLIAADCELDWITIGETVQQAQRGNPPP